MTELSLFTVNAKKLNEMIGLNVVLLLILTAFAVSYDN